MQLPALIDDTETIVRAIRTPAHFDEKKKVFKAAAYKPKVGESILSVIRQRAGDNFCKNKSVEIHAEAYIGMLAIKAKTIRDHGCGLDDYPDDFPGHAHIDHRFVRPPDHEPATAHLAATLHERCKELLKASVHHVDLWPDEPGWKGKPLKID